MIYTIKCPTCKIIKKVRSNFYVRTQKYCSQKCVRRSEKTKKLLSKVFKVIAKEKGFGLWMRDRKNTPFILSHKKTADFRRGKTYKEIYGDRAEEEAKKRRKGNRKRWINRSRKYDRRPKHNGITEYKIWRTKVFERDSYLCQKCNFKGYVEAHHIKSWSKYSKLRYEVSNGITLCIPCHKKENMITRLKEKI